MINLFWWPSDLPSIFSDASKTSLSLWKKISFHFGIISGFLPFYLRQKFQRAFWGWSMNLKWYLIVWLSLDPWRWCNLEEFFLSFILATREAPANAIFSRKQLLSKSPSCTMNISIIYILLLIYFYQSESISWFITQCQND